MALCAKKKGEVFHLRLWRGGIQEEIQTENCLDDFVYIYNINELIIQTQQYAFSP